MSGTLIRKRSGSAKKPSLEGVYLENFDFERSDENN